MLKCPCGGTLQETLNSRISLYNKRKIYFCQECAKTQTKENGSLNNEKKEG